MRYLHWRTKNPKGNGIKLVDEGKSK